MAEAHRGRLARLAGLIVNSTQGAIIRGRMVRDPYAPGVQVIPVRYLFKPDEEARPAHSHAVAEGTGPPMLIYVFHCL